jgi:1A family penicillin-binding protein
MSSTRWRDIWQKRLQQLKEPLVAVDPATTNQISDFSEKQVNFFKKIKQKVQKLWFNLRTMKKSKLFALIAFFAFLCVFLGSIFTGILLVVLAKDLPQPGRIVRREGFATKIYDRDGNLIYDVFEKERRTPVQLYEIPDHLKKATIAIEDKDFYSHKGFDPKGYVRSVYYVFRGRRLAGGSTLTQQLVKNVLLTSERSLIRKIKEFVLALEIEAKYSKDEILQMYLNEAPYGGTAWGVEEAARTYFGKGVTELNLTESAILAGLPQSPSYYSPFSESKAYEGRTQAVLRRMREDGYISVEEEKKSLEELANIKFASRSGTLKAPHFVMYVKKLLEDKYGEKAVELGGLRVTTSIDIDLQEKAQQIVAEEIAKVDNDKYHITNGATIVMNPQTGEILAMVGSKNYDDPDYDGKFNVVTSKNRQPGSTIKPVTYVTALKKGYTASTLLMDTLTRFPGGAGQPDYVPTNYDNKEHGPLQLRYNLGNSMNITAVKMLSLVGIKDMLTTAYEMGISTLEPTTENLSRLGLSVTLGGGEVSLLDLATAYSAFANTGYKVEPVAILKVTDKDGNVLEEFKSVPGKRVLTEGEAFIISHILSDNSARLMTFGENNLLKFTGRQVAAKTGTTNDRKDNWTIGWTPQVIVGTWVGNNDNTPMRALVSGVSGAAPIWRRLISEYLKDKPVVEFTVPEDVVTADVDMISGYRAHDGFPSRTEYFIKGTEPVGDDPVHQKLKICKGQGKLATPVDVARGDFEEKEYFTFKENDPFMKDGVNQWQKGIDEWVSKQSDERYRSPTEYCNTMDQVHVWLNPGDQTQVNSSFDVRVEPTTAHDVTKVEIFVNGESKKTFTSSPYEVSFTLPEGKYTIKAEVIDSQGNRGTAESRIGVNIPWNWEPTPTPTPTKIPTSAPSPSPTTAATPTP